MNNKLDIHIYSEKGCDPLAADNAAIKEYRRVADEYNAAANNGNRLRVHLVLNNQALVNTLRRLPLEKETARNIELYAYTTEDLWSMDVLGIKAGSKPLLDRRPIKAESNSRVHLVLFGASAQAESLAIHTALVAHYPNYCRNNRLRTRITWVSDRLMDFTRFKQQYRGLLENSYTRNVIITEKDVTTSTTVPKYAAERRDFVDIEWEFVEGRSYDDALAYKLCKWSQDEEQQLTIAVCYDDDSRNIDEAIALPLKQSSRPPVILKVKNDEAVKLLQQGAAFDHLIPIGVEEGTPASLTAFINMAQYINHAYCNMRATTKEEQKNGASTMVVATEPPTQEELQRLWNAPGLTTSKRWSNIYNSFTLNTKMRSLGFAADEWEKLFAINEKEVEIMAEVEHNRWSVEELILGYIPTTSEEHNEILADTEKRELYKAEFKHDDLRNYSELGVDSSGLSVTRYDAGLTRTLPLIAYAGYIAKKEKDE